ncbi:MAG: hypothetical protein WBQ23_10040 [Bacteroidota bacterium]
MKEVKSSEYVEREGRFFRDLTFTDGTGRSEKFDFASGAWVRCVRGDSSFLAKAWTEGERLSEEEAKSAIARETADFSGADSKSVS